MKLFKDLMVLAVAICIAITPGLYPLTMALRKDRIRPSVMFLSALSVVIVGLAFALWHVSSTGHWPIVPKIASIIVVTVIINVALSHRVGYGPKYGRVLDSSYQRRP